MIYPLFWRLSKLSIAIAAGVMCSLFALSYMPSIWPIELLRKIFAYMIIWWLGVILADIYTRRIKISYNVVALLTILLVLLPLNRMKTIVAIDTLNDFCWGIGFAGFIGLCFALKERGWKLWPLTKLKLLGDMSYTLYVTHFPMLVLLSGWLMMNSPTGELPKHFGWVVAGIVGTTLIAYFLHFVIEKPFIRHLPRPAATPTSR